MTHPVAQTVGVGFVDFGDGDIDIKTIVQFFVRMLRGSKMIRTASKIIDLFERYMLGLHLVPDGIDGFNTREDTDISAPFCPAGHVSE